MRLHVHSHDNIPENVNFYREKETLLTLTISMSPLFRKFPLWGLWSRNNSLERFVGAIETFIVTIMIFYNSFFVIPYSCFLEKAF